MYRIILTASQEQELEQVFKNMPDRRLRARCQAVLMAVRGRARHEIAQDPGIHRTTLRLWLQSYKGGPASCGLQRANWTYAELAAYLYQQTGIAVSETTMREFCRRQQIRPIA